MTARPGHRHRDAGPVRDAVRVGVASTSHEAVFTHRGKITHLHLLDPGATGGVDRVACIAGARGRVPR